MTGCVAGSSANNVNRVNLGRTLLGRNFQIASQFRTRANSRPNGLMVCRRVCSIAARPGWGCIFRRGLANFFFQGSRWIDDISIAHPAWAWIDGIDIIDPSVKGLLRLANSPVLEHLNRLGLGPGGMGDEVEDGDACASVPVLGAFGVPYAAKGVRFN